VVHDLDPGTALDAGVLLGRAAIERAPRLGSCQGNTRVGDHGPDSEADSLLEAATFGNSVAGSTLAGKVERVLVRDVVVPGSVAAAHARKRRAKGSVVGSHYISGIDDRETS
jgi:hypothetical protein